MNAFHFNKNEEPQRNESGRAREMEDTIQVANISPLISDEYISATQQVLDIFKPVLHHSLIEHVKSEGLIVQIKEIKVAVFNHTNTKEIINEDLRKKLSRQSDR